MVEKTKASKGASVAKAGNVSGQTAPVLAKGQQVKGQWDQKALDRQQPPSAPVCQDNLPENSPDSDPLSRIPDSARARKPAEKPAIGEQIGRQLRSVYNDVLAQPVPDRFLDLLRELEKDPK